MRNDWSSEENGLAVSSYFGMLRKEVDGEPFVKMDYNREVVAQTGRTKGSVEYKFQNISSWLQEKGLRYIDGYKPAHNKQASLLDAIEEYGRIHGIEQFRSILDDKID